MLITEICSVIVWIIAVKITAGVIHIGVFSLAVWTDHPIIVKKFNLCPTEVTRCSFLNDVKNLETHGLSLQKGAT